MHRHRNFRIDDEEFHIRPRRAEDDESLRAMMRLHMQRDPGWPPAYAHNDDPADWLSRPATIGRWVAVDGSGNSVGHIGLGAVKPGPCRDALQTALDCSVNDMAEICRTVVHPDARGKGLAGQLTRTALRQAIGSGLFPVSTVLSNRGSWLEMMLSTHWQEVCRVPSEAGNCELVALLPPSRLIDAVRRQRGESP